jgi:hypothetical protein
MSILPVINAPLGVQLNRVAFLIYSLVFAWPIWRWGHAIAVSGHLIFDGFIFCSLLGLFYSFIRARRSRWFLAVLGILIPAAFWSLMLPQFSRPAWWEWPIDVAIVLFVWMGIPIMLVTSLFRHKKTSQYFTDDAT